jgi:hypothetical protein
MKTLLTAVPTCIASIMARIPNIKCSFSMRVKIYKKNHHFLDGGFENLIVFN